MLVITTAACQKVMQCLFVVLESVMFVVEIGEQESRPKIYRGGDEAERRLRFVSR
jgi:hypothetical protein